MERQDIENTLDKVDLLASELIQAQHNLEKIKEDIRLEFQSEGYDIQYKNDSIDVYKLPTLLTVDIKSLDTDESIEKKVLNKTNPELVRLAYIYALACMTTLD
jgi:hypothetical protein